MPARTLEIRTQPIRKALCIAIQYRHLREQGWELDHAHEDVDRVKALLVERFGYAEQNITVLKDSDDSNQILPTRRNIINAMSKLVEGAIPGDHLLCHLSGHGAQVPNIDGREEDHMDEIFCPYDIDIQGPELKNYILDNEIKEILIKDLQHGVNLSLIFDCCHSGTMADLPHHHSDHVRRPGSRKPFSVNSRDMASIVRKVMTTEKSFSPLTATVEPEGSGAKQRLLPNVVCWSACKDPEETWNIPAKGGMFIELLVRCMSRNPSQTHEDVLHAISANIANIIHVLNISRRKSGKDPIATPKPELSTLGEYKRLLTVPIDDILGKKMI